MKSILMAFSLLFFGGTFAFGAIKIEKAHPRKLDEYVESGVIIGGKAGKGFSLLNVRREYSDKAKMERVVFDLGDLNGQPLRNKLSYFTVQVSKAPPRVVIDLSQVQKSGITPEKLEKRFSSSPFIKAVDITYDPEDLSTNLVLTLKKPVEVEVFKMPSTNKPSRIVIDFRHRSQGSAS